MKSKKDKGFLCGAPWEAAYQERILELIKNEGAGVKTLECPKCKTILVISVGCDVNPELQKIHKNKDITYHISGITSYVPDEIKCNKCGNMISTKSKCPKCKIPIVDLGCVMYKEAAEIRKRKEVILVIGRTKAEIELKCVKCETKFKYDRNTGVVK